MRKLASVLHIIDNISEWSGKIISLLIPCIVVIMTYEVVARYIFNSPTLWAYESTIFLFGGSMILGGAYTLRHRAHVNVDIVYEHLSPRGKAILDLITATLFFLFVGVLVWKGLEFGLTSVRYFEHTDSQWSPPIYFFKMSLPIGAGLIFLQGLAKFIRDLTTAVTGAGHHGH